MSLREKFEALRQFVETIPAEKLDMRSIREIGDGCGCVFFHSEQHSEIDIAEALASEVFELGGRKNNPELNQLFCVGGYASRSYTDPRGQPAKDEFLRRLDVLKEKYCGAEQ